MANDNPHDCEQVSRPSFQEIFLTMAHHLARRSTCKRLQVGTVISSIDHCKILAIGYNGNARGLPNGCDFPNAVGNCGCLHSEENAAIHCDAPRTTEKFVYVTHLPCVLCAKRLINLGSVRKVHYCYSYRDKRSLELFDQVGIEIHKYEKTLNIH